ncbi:MAG: hypothetical protein RL235_316 [Chlamydiota bacterium]|jgi:hypothetical protein
MSLTAFNDNTAIFTGVIAGGAYGDWQRAESGWLHDPKAPFWRGDRSDQVILGSADPHTHSLRRLLPTRPALQLVAELDESSTYRVDD